jgi:hypothetical protein
MNGEEMELTEDKEKDEGNESAADEDGVAPDYALLVDNSLHTIQTSGPAAGLEFTHKSRDFSNLFVARGQRDFIPDSLEGKSLALERSLLAQRQVLAEERIVNTKTACLATWYPDLNLAHCHAARGNYFRSMGRSVDGRLWLLPDECLFLIESGSLLCDYATVHSSEALQERGDAKAIPMSVQQAMECMIDFNPSLADVWSRRRVNIDEYVVYGYLRRLGFLVIRHDLKELIPQSIKIRKMPPASGSPASQELVKPNLALALIADLFRRVYGVLRSVLSPLRMVWSWFYHPKTVEKQPQRSLTIPIAPIKVPHQDFSSSGNLGSPKAGLKITYDVYRSSTHTTFKKSDPGPPDYHVSIVNVYSPPPCAADWQKIMSVFKEQATSVKLAVVETASVSFFDVTTREVISKGSLNPRQVKKKSKRSTK